MGGGGHVLQKVRKALHGRVLFLAGADGEGGCGELRVLVVDDDEPEAVREHFVALGSCAAAGEGVLVLPVVNERLADHSPRLTINSKVGCYEPCEPVDCRSAPPCPRMRFGPPPRREAVPTHAEDLTQRAPHASHPPSPPSVLRPCVEFHLAHGRHNAAHAALRHPPAPFDPRVASILQSAGVARHPPSLPHSPPSACRPFRRRRPALRTF
jgi:hypothetical protein